MRKLCGSTWPNLYLPKYAVNRKLEHRKLEGGRGINIDWPLSVSDRHSLPIRGQVTLQKARYLPLLSSLFKVADRGEADQSTIFIHLLRLTLKHEAGPVVRSLPALLTPDCDLRRPERRCGMRSFRS